MLICNIAAQLACLLRFSLRNTVAMGGVGGMGVLSCCSRRSEDVQPLAKSLTDFEFDKPYIRAGQSRFKDRIYVRRGLQQQKGKVCLRSALCLYSTAVKS